jgi:sugar O-acyltransferase (sialic acid O-acetyltransferase NeuD family)
MDRPGYDCSPRPGTDARCDNAPVAVARELVIVGAGGLGRETAAAVRAQNAASTTPSFARLGFLDDDPALSGTSVDGVPVLGPVDPELLATMPDAQVVVCTGGVSDRFSWRRIVARLGLPTDRYATVVHPSAVLADGCTLGPGSVVLAAVVATTAVELGAHVVVMPTTVVTHDDAVGSFVTFGAGVKLAGGVTVGDGAYLGAGALVREGGHIGAWSVVGMGAVVLGDVPTGEAWVGNPARRLRTLELPPDDPTP